VFLVMSSAFQGENRAVDMQRSTSSRASKRERDSPILTKLIPRGK
jgi:hypothetical protein